jgi:hypothetical protein
VSSTPFRQSDPNPSSRPPGGLENPPDPWGVRRAEQLLTSLEGVLSARVVTTPLGEVSEVHILAQSGLQPKQLVRNIESALLAQLGLKVDHRKISIAQTAEVRPLEVLERGAVRERSMRRAALFDNLVVAPGKRPHRISIQVTLSFGDIQATAEEESSDTPRSRVEAAARAAVSALDQLLADNSVALEGSKIIEAFDREFVMVAVQGLGGREAVLLIGTAEVKESAERAAVFAVLDATNRWAEARRPA